LRLPELRKIDKSTWHRCQDFIANFDADYAMTRNGKNISLSFLSLLTFLVIGGVSLVLADDCDNIPSDQTNIGNKIACLAGKVSQLSSQAGTLKNQIAQFDYQIRLTSLKIQDTQDKIALLGGRIDQLEVSLNDLTNAFSGRAVETYKMSRIESSLAFLLSAADIDSAVSRFHYLQKIQEADRSLLGKLQEAQTTYQSQKTDQETLQSELKKQQANLNSQKAAKNSLLAATKNDEKKYQQLLAQARAEYEAIQAIIAGKGKETQIGHVGEGQKIANVIQGASCNSSNSHVHFIVRKSGGLTENPFLYLQSGISYDNCSGSTCGSNDGDSFNPSGPWIWPINSKIKFSQGYGSTWAVRNTWVGRIYSFHNGIDINSDSSSEVKAVRAGELYQGSYNVGCLLKYVRVDHDDSDLDTLFLHVNY